MSKKIIAIALALTLALSLYGCSNGVTPTVDPSEPEASINEKTFTEADLQGYLDAYNLVLAETFGAETESTGYYRLYKASGTEKSDSEEDKLLVDIDNPDALIPESELSDNGGIQQGGDYDGYIIDPSYGICYKVTNFENLEAIKESLRAYMDDEVFTSEVANNFIEFDGTAYLVRGGRGYGTQRADSLKITAQTADSITAEAMSYLFDEEDGKLILTFKITNGTPVLVSATPDSENTADAELTELLQSVSTYNAGTAGASLKALIVGVKLLNFGAETTLSDSDIAMAAENYKSTLSSENMDVFASNLEEIKAACEVLWTDEAASTIESAGITDAAESYDKDMAERIFADLGEKGA